MATERHVPGTDPQQDAYVYCYREWLGQRGVQGKVLDLGCGTGWCVSEFIAGSPDVNLVLGVDLFEGKHAEHPKVVYLEQDAVSFRAPEQFDFVLSFEFIEHIPHYELLKVLRNVHASLKEGGRFIGSTPNGPHGQFVFKTTNPYHIREWHADELRNVLEHFFREASVTDIGLNILGFECRK